MNHSLTALAIVISVGVMGCDDGHNDAIEASGTVEGTDVRIASEVGGRVKEIRADEGTSVSRGDTLVIIDDADYQIQLRQALANAEGAAAQHRLALEGSRKEDIIQADAAFKTAEADYLRAKDLLGSNTVTQKQYDDAYARYVAAQQTYEKLVKGLRQEEIVAARARRDAAVAQADQLKKKMRDCFILAPSDGVITLKSVEVGELVVPGTRVIRITRLDPVKLMIYINEMDLGRVHIGQKADIRIDGVEDRSFPGTVVYISPMAEFTPKNVQTKEERTKLVFGVKIQVSNPDGTLKPGMPADAHVAVGSRSD